VTRYLLDTNVISDALKPRPNPAITTWVGNQASTDLFISTFTVAELWRGILERAPGRRRHQLETWFIGATGPQALFAERILPFDRTAAMQWARIMAEGTAIGRPRSGLDMIIAAIAAASGCVVVTANERHFGGVVELLNPASGQPSAPGRGPV
jgi:predicted nucleic acid-binding protein